MSPQSKIGPAEYEAALALPPGSLDGRTRQLLDEKPLAFTMIDAAGQAQLQAETAKRIEEGFTVVGAHRAGIWRDAWADQLERFEKSNYDVEALNPAFMAATPVLRWQGEYITPASARLELDFLEVFRDWLFRTELADIDHLYEFGSGSAFNVAAYAKLYPTRDITALDWAPAAVRIAELLREKLDMRVAGRRFDFFNPDKDLVLAKNSGVLTMCALEQIGDRHGTFIDYLLASRPKRVVHMEPTPELYDANSPHDALALRYHGQRKYLSGLLPALQGLEKQGKLRITRARRLRIGSRFHECFTLIVWEPV